MKSFVDGFFPIFGLMVAVFVGIYIHGRGIDEFRKLPLIQEITNNYQQGWDATLILGENLVTRVISLPPSHADSQAPNVDVQISWSADRVTRKLIQQGWSKGKINAAYAYLAYIETYLEEAVYDMEATGVSASITLAQGILESDAGRSRLAKVTNNHFGIKALPTKDGRKKIRARQFDQLSDKDFRFKPPAYGVSQHHDDHKYDRFEKYYSVSDSYRRHSNLLLNTCTKARKGCYEWIWQEFPVQKERMDISPAARTFQSVSGYGPEDFFGDTTVPYYAAQAAGLKMAGYATSKTYHKKLVYLIETYELYRLDSDLIRAKKST